MEIKINLEVHLEGDMNVWIRFHRYLKKNTNFKLMVVFKERQDDQQCHRTHSVETTDEMKFVVLTYFSLDQSGEPATDPSGTRLAWWVPSTTISWNFLDIFTVVYDCVSFLSSAVLVGKCSAYAQSQFDLRGRRSVPGALPSHHSLPGCSQSCFQPQPDVYNPQTLTFQWLLSNKLSSPLSHRPRLQPHYPLLPISPASTAYSDVPRPKLWCRPYFNIYTL